MGVCLHDNLQLVRQEPAVSEVESPDLHLIRLFSELA